MSRRHRRRLGDDHGELMLAAMVDILVNILIFLLTLYGTGPEGLAEGVDVPSSAAGSGQPDKVTVAVGGDGIAVQGRTVLALVGAVAGARLPADALDAHGSVTPLADALRPLLPDESVPADGAGRELVVQVDRRLPWDVVGPIVATASDAGFARVRFLVRTGD